MRAELLTVLVLAMAVPRPSAAKQESGGGDKKTSKGVQPKTSMKPSKASPPSKGKPRGFHADGDWDFDWKPSKPSKPEIPRRLRLPGTVITSASGLPLAKFPIRVAVLGRGDTMAWSVPYSLPGKVRDFGRLIAGKKYALLTGGGTGLPREAEKEAHTLGGETWAISAAKDVDEQLASVFDASHTSVLYTTGTGPAAGSIEREAPLVQLSNIRTFWNGQEGTFGELIASLHAPGVIALMAESGGVAERAQERILPHVGVPKHVKIVSARDPAGLLQKAEAALRELGTAGVSTTPKAGLLYSPKPHVSVVPEQVQKERVVMSFLLDDGGRASSQDRAMTQTLVDLALRTPMKGKKPFLVGGANQATQQALVKASSTHDVGGVLVSHQGGEDTDLVAKASGGRTSKEKLRLRKTGKGDGVGEFASYREVVEHADVVFVTSAYFKNLSGLTYVLRQPKKSIVAVLEMESTGSRHLEDILRTARGGSLSERFVFSRDPARLIEKVKKKLEAKPKKEKFEPEFRWLDEY